MPETVAPYKSSSSSSSSGMHRQTPPQQTPHLADQRVEDEGRPGDARQHPHSKVGKGDAVLAQRVVGLPLRKRQRLCEGAGLERG